MTHSLHADGLALGAIEAVGAASQLLEVHAGLDSHVAGVDLEYLLAGPFVRKRKLDLLVDTSRTHEGRVQDVDSVGGGDQLKRATNEVNIGGIRGILEL